MACIHTLTKSISGFVCHQAARTFSAFSHTAIGNNIQGAVHAGPLMVPSPKSLLPPSPVLLIPAAGMKQMGKLRKRCRHCFFIMIDERLHVWCDVHARHKQMQMIPKPKTVIRTTHATQGKLRPW